MVTHIDLFTAKGRSDNSISLWLFCFYGIIGKEILTYFHDELFAFFQSCTE